MDHKQQQSLNEAIMQQVFGSPPPSPSTTSIDEDNTAAVAKQVKKAVKEYTSGKLVVRSKGGKSRFIMVRADKIDNKLREMMADVMYPKANIHDRDDISYGNISSMIISAGTDAWIEALGLKEEEAATELDEAFDMKKMLKIFNKLKKNDTIKIKYDSSISKGKEFQTFVVTSPKRTVGKRGVERVIMKHVDNPTGVKYTLYNRDGSVSLAIGDMAASMTDIQESVHEQLDEALTLASDNLNLVIKTAEKLSKQSPDLTYYVVKHNERYMKGMKYAYYEVYQSVDMHLVRGKAKKVAGYGAKVDMRESVLLDEAHHDQRAADKSLFNAMKVVDPKAKWKMVKTDPSRFGDDVEITSQKMAEYGDWTLMTWSDGKLMHVWYDHPNGEGSVPEKDFKRVANDMMSESVLVDEVTSIASSVESRKKVTKVLKKKGIGFHTSKGDIMVNPKNLIAAKSALNKEFAGDFETNSGMKLKATKKADISDEVEHLDENGHTAKEIMSKGKKLGDWVGKSYYEYEGNVWMVYGDDVVNKGSVDQAKKTLNKMLLKNLKF